MPHVLDVDLGPGVHAWFTGRGVDAAPAPRVGQAGNLSARRPHQPNRLAADRAAAFGRHGIDPSTVHLMRQVHGATVTTITANHVPGAVAVDSDGMVTTTGRALAVLTADCLPVLLAGPTTTAAVHAGRGGLVAGVLQAAVAACRDAGDDPDGLRAVIGPAIHACCYEVPAALRDQVADVLPEAAATTTWATPSLDLPRAGEALLERAGVAVEVIDACTRCDSSTWFSHRADAAAGRQAGVVARATEVDG